MFAKIISATCLVIVVGAIYIFLNAVLKDVPTTKVIAGTLESVTVSRGMVFSDSATSELALSDGTHVTVKGAVDFWRRGSEVVHLVPDDKKSVNRDKTDNKWCIGDECYWQK